MTWLGSKKAWPFKVSGRGENSVSGVISWVSSGDMLKFQKGSVPKHVNGTGSFDGSSRAISVSFVNFEAIQAI